MSTATLKAAVSRGAQLPEIVQADVDLVAGAAAKLTAVNRSQIGNDYAAWSKLRRDAEDGATARLVGAGAVIRYKGNDTDFRFRGLKATSTCGLPGALGNWKAAAEKRLAERGGGR